jgi:hypothetical protein
MLLISWFDIQIHYQRFIELTSGQPNNEKILGDIGAPDKFVISTKALWFPGVGPQEILMAWRRV